MSNRKYLRNAFETTLTAGINSSTGTIPLASVTGLTSPGYLVIDHDNPAKREYIEYTGISTLDLTGCTRGLAGSAGGVGQAHDSGATVRAVMVHQVVDQLWTDIESIETDVTAIESDISDLEDADSNHFGATGGAHGVATGSVAGFMSASDKIKLDSQETNATADQTGAEIETLLNGEGWYETMDMLEVGLQDNYPLSHNSILALNLEQVDVSHGPFANSLNGLYWTNAGGGYDSTKIYINRGGLYRVTAQVEFGSNSTGVRSVRIRKNGTEVALHNGTPNSSASHTVQVTKDVVLDDGDDLEIAIYQNSGSDLTIIASGCFFQVTRLCGPETIGG